MSKTNTQSTTLQRDPNNAEIHPGMVEFPFFCQCTKNLQKTEQLSKSECKKSIRPHFQLPKSVSYQLNT